MADPPRRLIAVIGFVIGVAFLVIALRGANFRGIVENLRDANFALVIPFLVTLAALNWVRAVRWSVLLRALRKKTTGTEVFPAVMIGFASNVVLPPPLSDFVRMYVAGRRLRIKNTAVFATIVLERVFDLVVIALLLGVALAMMPKPTDELILGGYLSAMVAFVAFMVVTVYAVWSDGFLRITRRMLSLLPGQIESVLKRHLDFAASGLAALASARRIIEVTMLTLIQWTLMALGIYISMIAVDINLHVSAAVVVLAITFVGITLPSTPGAVGTIQLSFALALAPFGVSSTAAVSASIFWHVIGYCFVVSVGLYYFLRLGYTLREIRDSAKVGSLENAE